MENISFSKNDVSHWYGRYWLHVKFYVDGYIGGLYEKGNGDIGFYAS